MCSAKFLKRILITGGAGFIGSHMVIHFVNKYPNYFIVNLDKLDYCASLKNLDIIKKKRNYKFIQGDICQADFIRYILKEEKINNVIHFAAQSHVDQSFWSSLGFTQTNVFGSHVLLNASYEAKVEKFIHVSTDEVYGGEGCQTNKESSKLQPSNPYAATKASAEFMVLSYYQCFNFPVIITRSNNVYGPHKYPETVIPKFICQLQNNLKCCIHGDGSSVRNFLYVSDVIKAYDVIFHEGEAGQTYNIGTDFKISVIKLAEFLIKKIKGNDVEVGEFLKYVDDRPYNDHHYKMDSSKLTSLGWKPRVPWEEGVDVTIDWYSKNFNNWNYSSDALHPFPRGSNTMMIYK